MREPVVSSCRTDKAIKTKRAPENRGPGSGRSGRGRGELEKGNNVAATNSETKPFTWSVNACDVHEPYELPKSKVGENRTAFVVETTRLGGLAVTLERALALAGLLEGAREAEPDCPELERELPRLKLESVTVTIGDRKEPIETWGNVPGWPQRVDRITANVLWLRDGKYSRQMLETDLGMAEQEMPPGYNPQRRPEPHPARAQPAVTRQSELTVDELTKLVLAAHSAPGGSELWPDDENEHTAAAVAAAEIALNGESGRLITIERLVSWRVMPCIPKGLWKGKAIDVRLFGKNRDEPEARIADDQPSRRPVPTGSSKMTSERHNRLHYESTGFKGERGILVGRRIPTNSTLANALLGRTDGDDLWEMKSSVVGRLLKLDYAEQKLASKDIGYQAGHAATWWTGKGADRQEAVHLLDHADVVALRQRVEGLLIEQAIARERTVPSDTLPHDHPLRTLMAEYKRRQANPTA